MNPRQSLCTAVRAQLASAESPDELSGPLAAHAGGCLRCQAEVARSRRLRRTLAEMADETLAAPEGLSGSVEIAIDRPAVTSPHRLRQGTTVAAAAGALAAAGTLVVIGLMRARSAA